MPHATHFQKIHEVRHPERRLGRHVKHDERSKNYPLSALVGDDAPIATKLWTRRVPPFNQGDIGDCTGNAEVGLLCTDPFYVPGRNLSENDAIDLYSLATHIDPVDGQSFPPDDTGSTGIDICKAAMQKGYITNYHHGFDIPTVQRYLSNVGPLILGINWYDSFDTPDAQGVVQLPSQASVRGGHELEMAGINVENHLYALWNSWGTWGLGGMFFVPFEVFERLMDEEGDVTASVTQTIL